MGKDKAKDKKDKKGNGDAPEAEGAANPSAALSSVAPQEAGWDNKPKMKTQGVRAGTGEAPDRARQAAGMGEGHQRQGLRAVRGPRRGRQGRHHQGHHRAHQPARLPGGRTGLTHRAREVANVLPALHAASAGRRRGRAVRPQLVQPGGRRAGHGLHHGRAGADLPEDRAGRGTGHRRVRRHPAQVLARRDHGRPDRAVRRAHHTTTRRSGS